MSFLGNVGNVLGSIGREVGDILSATLPTAIPAGLEYLATRDAQKAAKDIAKARAKASGTAAVYARAMQGSQPMRFRPNGGNGMRMPAGVVAAQPQVQPALWEEAAPYVEKGLEAGVRYLLGGNGKTVGGVVVASGLEDFYTEAGNPRGTVASMANDRITYWSNRGQPVIFSRDASICRRIKKLSGKAYRASGGSTSYRRKR